MIVFVIMVNDFPHAVAETREAADRIVKEGEKRMLELMRELCRTRWHVHEFEVQS